MAEITKPCPTCGRALVFRTNSQNGSEFMACTGWALRDSEDRPLCRHTEKVPAAVYMRRAGAMELPGLEAE